MRNKILMLFVVICFGFVAKAQTVTINENIGKENFKVEGVELLFDGNKAERYYFKIKDGKLMCYLVNHYEGRVIQYKTYEGEIKKMDLKSVEYKDYQDYGKFMYIKAKKFERYVKEENKSLDLVDKVTVTTDKDESSTFLLFVDSEESGEKLIKRLKKGK